MNPVSYPVLLYIAYHLALSKRHSFKCYQIFSESGWRECLTKKEYTTFLRGICTPGEWQTITAIYAVSGAFGLAIQTYCPHTNFASADYTRKVCGRNVDGRKRVAVYIMFTLLGYVEKGNFNTNRCVPLLCKTQVLLFSAFVRYLGQLQ